MKDDRLLPVYAAIIVSTAVVVTIAQWFRDRFLACLLTATLRWSGVSSPTGLFTW